MAVLHGAESQFRQTVTGEFARHDPIALNLVRQFDAAAPSWDTEHGPASARACEFLARIRYLRGVCRKLGQPRVLDIGCGTGQLLVALSSVIASGVGVDISGAMVQCARRAARGGRLRFAVADAVRFCNDCEEFFDLVLLIGVLEHLPDQESAVAALRRVLKPRGRLVVISPHPWSLLLRLKHLVPTGRAIPPTKHLSPHRVTAAAQRHGFELAAIHAIPYAPWAALSSVFARVPATGLPGRKSPFTGCLRGAFAAEFTPAVAA
jgi:SAM-dependent methyltransferase